MPKVTVTPTSARGQRARAAQRAHARARQRRIKRIGLGLVIVALVALGGAWWLVGRDATSQSEVLHTFTTQDFHSLAFDPDDPDTIYFGHHQGLQVSHDAGRHWQDATLRGVDAMQLAMPAADPQRRYAAGHNVFYVSADGGATWQSQPTNLPNLDLHTFAGSPSDANRLYAIPVGETLWTSADGGQSWSTATLPAGDESQPIALAVAPQNPLTVFVARNGQLATSHDAGLTWQTSPGPQAMVLSLAVAADPDQTMYAGTNQGLMRRSAAGVWTRLPIEVEGAVLAVAVSVSDPARIAIIDQRGRFYRSDSRGDTWTRN